MKTQARGFRIDGWSVLVHGGAGSVPAEAERRQLDGCARAAEAGARVLRTGGSALDAVQRAVEVLEDDPEFNAGTGAALNSEGHVQLDAAIMEGAQLRAGAVGALPPFLHPVAIARAVLEQGLHVLYVADGAEQFARQAGFAPVDESHLITPGARAALERWHRTQLPPRHGNTVGAVARDALGHVAAATSTGGITGKRPGRIGDSPLLGAGTYADDEAGAASATGLGEGILRVNLTGVLVAALRDGTSPAAASERALEILARRIGTSAGVIAVDRRGSLGWARSSEAMPWAAVWDGGADAGI